MSTVVNNSNMLISFLLLLATPAFEAGFSLLDSTLKSVLEWVASAVVPVTKEIMADIEVNCSQKNYTKDVTVLVKWKTIAPRAQNGASFLGFSTSLAVSLYALKNILIREIFFCLIRDWDIPVTVHNIARFF